VSGGRLILADDSSTEAKGLCGLIGNSVERHRLVMAGHAVLVDRYQPSAMRIALAYLHLPDPVT
jgi:hypothetical protein